MLNAIRLLLDIMTPRERRRLWLLVSITFVLALFEAGSVVSVLPFLRLLAEPELIDTIPALSWIYEFGGFTSDQQFLIWAGFAVFVVTLLGLCLKMVTIWLATRFALMRSFSFSSRLLSKYLHQPYAWFLSRHTSNLGNAILAEVDRVVSEALLPAMRMIPEAFTVLLMVAALCFLEPEIAIVGALLLGGSYGLIFFFVRRLLTRLGETRLVTNQARFHVVQEATSGIKELKIMGLENGFLIRFRAAALLRARAATLISVISVLPRQFIEAVAFGGMILLVLVLLVRGEGNMADLLPTLGLVAAIGLRLIPALQTLYQRGASLRQSEAVLKKIHDDMKGLELDPAELREKREARPPLALTQNLELRDVKYAYPGTEKSALYGLSMSIAANTTVGIVGGTGAGKTTLVDIVLGLLFPSGGSILVDGTEITSETRRAWQKTIGYVPQEIFLADGTIAENIAFGRTSEEIDMEEVQKAAKVAALHDFIIGELSQGYDTAVGERGVRLSGGQRQRIGIARAIYHNPTTLIFDEATSALDNLTEAAVMDAVHALAGQKTILMVAHRLSTVRDCDVIFLMRDGQVAASGTYDQLAKKDEEFRKMAGYVDQVGIPNS